MSYSCSRERGNKFAASSSMVRPCRGLAGTAAVADREPIGPNPWGVSHVRFYASRGKKPWVGGLYRLCENWVGAAFFMAALSVFLLSLVQTAVRQSVKRLEAAALKAQQGLDVVGAELRTLFDGLMFNLAAKLNIKAGEDTRVSMYVHDGESHFILCGRYSPNPKFRTPGRPSYPANQGCIAAGWENGWWFENDLGEGKDYKANTNTKYHISPSELRKIPMKSNLFGVKRLGADSSPIGVIVAESVDRERFDQHELKEVLTEAAEYLGPIISALRAYVPDPRTATSKGF